MKRFVVLFIVAASLGLAGRAQGVTLLQWCCRELHYNWCCDQNQDGWWQ